MTTTIFIILSVIFIILIGLFYTKLYKKVRKPKIDILQTLDGRYIPTVNGKFTSIIMRKPQFDDIPVIFDTKEDAEEYLFKWLNMKGMGLKSVGLDKQIKL